MIKTQLWWLVWKHMKERTRQFNRTFWEFFCSILIIFLLVLSIAIVTSGHDVQKSDIGNQMHDMEIIFSPKDNVTEDFIYRVRNRLKENPISDRTGIKVTKAKGFRDEDKMYEHLDTINLNKSFFVVSFKSKPSEFYKMPLTYTIGLNGLKDRSYELQNQYHGTGKSEQARVNSDKLDLEDSIALTRFVWAMNNIYMEEVSGEPIKEDISIDLTVQPRSRTFRRVADYLTSGTLVAPLPFFLSKASRLINEKRYVLTEMIKMDGVTHNVVRVSHLIDTAVFGLLYAIIATLLFKLSIQESPILPHTNPVFVTVALLMHQLNITGLAFITCVLSQNYHHADSVTLLIYLSTIILHYLLSAYVPKVYFWFMPHCPLAMFWNGVVYWERRGKGVGFSNLFKQPCASPNCIRMILVYLAFLCEMFILMLLAWYLNLLRPGKYGIGERWNFMCKKRFWKIKKKKVVSFHVTVERNKHVIRDVRYFERMTKGADLAIKVAKVTKVFKGFKKKTVIALEDITLDVKKGEITVLLGINGAGKSTLMSIVTGMCKPTAGNVYVDGLDLSTRILEVRKDLTYCPQWNCCFDYLTVKENIMFFGRIRGKRDLEQNVSFIMRKLRIQLKENYYTNQLSEGMKRCLQVACALVGDADVLVLDEPTSGMDSQTRHALWDVLLMLRGKKTILISTVFMEEADAIGDRIALLHRGKLKCHGSPAFLKNALGFDFSLTVSLKKKEEMGPLQDEIANIVPDATVNIDGECIATFDVPSKDKDQFPVLFDALEEKKKALGILSLDVGMSMEKVFMRFINQFEDQELTSEILDDFEDVRYKGLKLWMQQFWTLVERSFMFMWTHKIQFLILQVLVPVAFILIHTYICNDDSVQKVLENRVYQNSEDLPEFEYFLAYSDLGPYLRTNVLDEYRRMHPEIDITYSKDIPKDINDMINFRTDTNKPNNTNVFGFKVERNRSILYYPWPSKSVVTKAVDLFSNFYMTLHYPQARNRSITMVYDPLDLRERISMTIIPAKGLGVIVLWAGYSSFFLVLPLIPLILLPVTEFHQGVRFLHMLAGCSAFVIWLSKLTAHLVVYVVIVPTSMFMATMLLTFDQTFDHLEFMGALMVFLFAYGPAFLTYLYVCSFFLHKDNAIHQIYISSIISSIVAANVLTINYVIVTPGWFKLPMDIFMIIASFILPNWTATLGMLHLGFVGRMNAYCINNRHLCPGNYEPLIGPISPRQDICCNTTKYPYSYYFYDDNHDYSAWMYLVILILQFFVNMIVVLLLQTRLLQYCTQKIVNYRYKVRPTFTKCKSVLDEQDFIEQQMRILHNCHLEERIRIMDDYAILASNMHKRYACVGRDCRVFNAVRGISFAVKKGQCVGILGPSGAGKTTTLNMMGGFTVMTKGDCNAGGYFIRRNNTHYLQNIFLTKDMAGLDRFMTGHDNLTVLSLLYGRSNRLTEKLVVHIMHNMGLDSYADLTVHSYSTGCARRLAVCSALIAAAPVAMLDEPSAGADPYTRLLVVRATRRMLQDGTACLFAEESMDWREMQSLCDCIAIILKGQLAALGSPLEIRTALANGYTAIIKLRITLLYVPDKSPDMVAAEIPDITTNNESDELPDLATNKESDEVPDKVQISETDSFAKTSEKSDKSVDIEPVSTPENVNRVRKQKIDNVKHDFEVMFENSLLAIEHMTILYYHILEPQDHRLQYSELFTKLEILKSNHLDIIEDYVIRETSINEVFSRLGRCAD